jgi:CBS domain-containing protein
VSDGLQEAISCAVSRRGAMASGDLSGGPSPTGCDDSASANFPERGGIARPLQTHHTEEFMLKVREVLKAKGHEVQTVHASETLADLVRRFTEDKVRCLVVVEGDELVGMVTIRDALTYIGRHDGVALEDSEIRDVMSGDVKSITPDTSLDEAAALFAEKRFNHLPVQEDGKLVGLVTPVDVLGRHLEDVREDAGLLIEYISGVYH